MAVPKKKKSKSRTKMRLSQYYNSLKLPNLAYCESCGHYIPRHRVCPYCGKYRGRQVLKEVVVKTGEE
jgi:large subunit ribosomal protein L32